MTSSQASTAHGIVKGTAQQGVSVWRGVPFAKPPVGKLRFRAPQPVEPWTGVRDAARLGCAATQPHSMMKLAAFSRDAMSVKYGEDCLTLNVYSPAADGQKRPVLFWIHGGAFFGGFGGQYDGSRLAREGDVVVVTCNYRMGPIGYLHFSDLGGEVFDSNLGTRDQIAALQWVQENIASFGGDPANVTIFGESAGGSSVCNLLAAPAARGLFHRAIAQSPAAAHNHDRALAQELAEVYLKYLGIRKTEIHKLVDVPVEKLHVPFRAFVSHAVNDLLGAIPFAPLVGDDVLPQAPLEAIAAGSAKEIPLIIGTNRDEATLFVASVPPVMPTTPKRLDTWFRRKASHAKSRILAAYPGFPERRVLLGVVRDAIFTMPSVRMAELQAEHAPVWMYRFDWTSPVLRQLGMGATHASELPFVFDQFDSITGRLLTNFAAAGSRDALGKRMRQAWLRFARTGKPAADGEDAWPGYHAERGRQVRVFNNADRIESDPSGHVRVAWDGVFAGKQDSKL
jgi:para-nitrobenzyl esterase